MDARVRRPVAGMLLGGLGMGIAGFGFTLTADSAQADAAGNSGTIKVVGVGDIDTIPENNPHQGCTFALEWYGFAKGDYTSLVSFELTDPTEGQLEMTGRSTVFVGEDAARGGKDLDARETYTLHADGLPHPQQGFHVRVTVTTDGRKGNDTKTKVFWFQNCDDGPPEPSTTPTTSTSPSPTESTSSPTESPTPSPTDPTSEPSSPPPSESPSTSSSPSVVPSSPGSHSPSQGVAASTAVASTDPAGGGGGTTRGNDPGVVPTRIAAGLTSVPTADAGHSSAGRGLLGLGAGLCAVGAVVGLSRPRGSARRH